MELFRGFFSFFVNIFERNCGFTNLGVFFFLFVPRIRVEKYRSDGNIERLTVKLSPSTTNRFASCCDREMIGERICSHGESGMLTHDSEGWFKIRESYLSESSTAFESCPAEVSDLSEGCSVEVNVLGEYRPAEISVLGEGRPEEVSVLRENSPEEVSVLGESGFAKVSVLGEGRHKEVSVLGEGRPAEISILGEDCPAEVSGLGEGCSMEVSVLNKHSLKKTCITIEVS